MMPTPCPAARIGPDCCGRENVLPAEFSRRGWEFAFQGIGEFNRSESVCQVLLVLLSNACDLTAQGCHGVIRQHRSSVLASFPLSDRQLPAVKIDVLHP